MQKTIITLMSDFGLRDPYVAEMKAVLLGICPEATIVDISHEIEKFNIRMGAYVLACAAPYFPKGTIHVAIVDPSVGTKRKPILIRAKGACFVGPDNGVLTLAAKKSGVRCIYEIASQKITPPRISQTFHGRDVFAPVAARLANGTQPKELGSRISKMAMPDFGRIARKKNMTVGEVSYIDDFGNIVTNFERRELEGMVTARMIDIRVADSKLKLKLCKTYADVEEYWPLALVGSHGFLEISVNQGNAAEQLKAKEGDKAILYRS